MGNIQSWNASFWKINSFGFKPQKTSVAFIGDSITHLGHHIKLIEHYYNVRFPQKDIQFVNKGVPGNSAIGVVDRFEWDIAEDKYTGKIDEATLMVGMNDVGRPLYNINANTSLERKDLNISNCIDNIEKIICKCVERGIRLTLITPSAYDETKGFSEATEDIQLGVNSYGLKNISEKISVLSKKYEIPLIDLWTPTTDAIDEQREKGFGGPVVPRSDRIHPDEYGGFFMGYQFIKQKNETSLVSSVEINVKTGDFSSENSTIIIENMSKNKIEYTYLSNSIPVAHTKYYKHTEDFLGYPVTQDINQEIIKIIGLEEGTYSIIIDGSSLSKTYTSAELEKGINIAIDPNNPSQQQAVKSYEITEQKNEFETKYRNIATAEYLLVKNNCLTTNELKNADNTMLKKAVKSLVEANPSDIWADLYIRYISHEGYGSKDNQSESWENIKDLEKRAKLISKPVRRTVLIIKNHI